MIQEEAALAFRSRRHQLLDSSLTAAADVARAVVGIQAQVVAPALWSLAVRMAVPASLAKLQEQLESSPRLVRTWGQRDTVHIYDPAAHWPEIVACLREWPVGARGGEQLPDSAVGAAAARIESLGRPVTRSDLFDLIPEDFLAYMASRTGPGTPAQRGAAGRFIWELSRRGELSAHTTEGREQSYVLRAARYPSLEWRDPAARDAAAVLVRAYLQANAPATVQDIAHFLGTRVTQVRTVVKDLAEDICEVGCGGRTGLLVLKDDRDALDVAAPTEWPARLLPKFDTMLMCHKDKSWTVPEASERPKIWAKAAQVNATVLHRGRLIATWKHKALKRAVKIDVTPLSGWHDDAMLGVEADATRFAAHLGVAEARVRLLR